MSPATHEDQYLKCVESACAHLDAIGEYGIAHGEAHDLLVLHGLAMYARDTARSASILIRAGRNLSAGALTRIVIEHAVLARWLTEHDDSDRRAHLFLRQSEVEQSRWYKVVQAAEIELSADGEAAANQKLKNIVPDFDTVKNLFGDSKMGSQLYLTYRNLSRFVHPATTTFGRYAEQLPHGLNLTPRLRIDQDSEALAFYLASATVMSALPYLTLLGEEQAAVSLLGEARRAGVLASWADADS